MAFFLRRHLQLEETVSRWKRSAPGPKFDYKLRWFERLQKYGQELLDLEVPVALIGDFNVMPTDLDAYKPERWREDALFHPEVRRAYAAMLKQGWCDAAEPAEATTPFFLSEFGIEQHMENSVVVEAGKGIEVLLDFLQNPGVKSKSINWIAL